MGRGTEFSLSKGYHSQSSPIIPASSFCAIFTHSWRVFPHNTDSGNPITTFSVSNLHIIATATEVNVLLRPISSATSTPRMSKSQTHLLTMNLIAQSWCARTLVPGKPGIEYMLPGTRSAIDGWIRQAFRLSTASSRHSCSNLLLIVFTTVFITDRLLTGLRTSKSSSTCSWTSLPP